MGLRAIIEFFTGRLHRECGHPNLYQRKWKDKDDTPMIYSHCPDCGYHDEGHVYADPDTWLDDEHT